MFRSLSRAEIRDVDRRAIEQYELPGIVLMENAGRGAADLLIGLGVNGRVVICAGKGNNAGDGFVIARHLDGHAIDVRVLLFCDPAELSGDAATNYRVLRVAGLEGVVCGAAPKLSQVAQELAAAEWIVDALLGTGTQGDVRAPYRDLIGVINAAEKKVFAIDLPSGMDCDTGKPLGASIRAEHTATFVARKIGFDAPEAAQWTGVVHVLDIGVPRRLLTELLGDRPA